MQTSLSSQILGTPLQLPLWSHLSYSVHLSPSSHGASTASLVCLQSPVSASQLSIVHELLSSHLLGSPQQNPPSWHSSSSVHLSPSSQGSPFAVALSTHIPSTHSVQWHSLVVCVQSDVDSHSQHGPDPLIVELVGVWLAKSVSPVSVLRYSPVSSPFGWRALILSTAVPKPHGSLAASDDFCTPRSTSCVYAPPSTDDPSGATHTALSAASSEYAAANVDTVLLSASSSFLRCVRTHPRK